MSGKKGCFPQRVFATAAGAERDRFLFLCFFLLFFVSLIPAAHAGTAAYELEKVKNERASINSYYQKKYTKLTNAYWSTQNTQKRAAINKQKQKMQKSWKKDIREYDQHIKKIKSLKGKYYKDSIHVHRDLSGRILRSSAPGGDRL